MRPEQVLAQHVRAVLLQSTHGTSNADLAEMAPRLLQELGSNRCMLLLSIGSTKEMFDETHCKLNVLHQANLNQHINTPRTVANALIDLLRVIAGCQQERSGGIIGRCHTIECIEYQL